MWCEKPLEVVCNNHSPAPIYEGYLPRIVVLVAHLLLSVLAVLVICVATCVCIVVLWSAPGAVSACCTTTYITPDLTTIHRLI